MTIVLVLIGYWPDLGARGDRKLNPLSQVLNYQRRSTAALLPIGVKWYQISMVGQLAFGRVRIR